MSTDDYSGAEKVAIDIIEGVSDDYELIYATRSGNINKVLQEHNIKYINIKELSIKEIRRIVKEYKPDIIHAHDYRASLMAAVSFVKVPIISHLHNNSPWIKTLHPYSFALLIASLRIKKILIVSKSIQEEYIFSKFINKKVECIGNPVSVEAVTSKVPENLGKKYDVCFSGRLTKQKNPIKFIKIISKLKEKNKDIKVVMLGEGELKSSCQKKIKELNLENNIKLLGFVKNPYIIMAQSKIFCLTSEWEGYGLVAFEALSLGLPCVVSDVGGLVDVVNECCGKLCNNNLEFENEIYKLLQDDVYYQKKSNNAILRTKKIENIDKYIKKIEHIYENMDT